MNKCPVCSYPVKDVSQDDSMNYNVDCFKCGWLSITDEAAYFLLKNYELEKQINNLSSW